MAGEMSAAKQDPYALLDQIHKLVEELRAKVAQQKKYINNLEKSIESHHLSIFKEVKS